MNDREISPDPVKYRQDWMKRLAEEVEKIEPLLPIKLLSDGIAYPRWVLNVEREFALVMLPVAALKGDAELTPKRMGAVLGHMCEIVVWMMEWLNAQIETPNEQSKKLLTKKPLTA